MSLLNKLFNRKYEQDLKEIFSILSNQEELLGMKIPVIPTPEGIKIDAAKIRKYTDSDGYKKFAQEAFARIVFSLDKIIDEKTSNEVRLQHCGAVRATLDLLRLSHNAKFILEEWDKEHKGSSLPTR